MWAVYSSKPFARADVTVYSYKSFEGTAKTFYKLFARADVTVYSYKRFEGAAETLC